jgi:hypothetical protein
LVDLAEIQAAYYMVAATGVLVAAVFYILNLRVQQANMKANLETRQAQFLLQLSQIGFLNPDSDKRYIDMMNWEWSDYNDFEKKYGTQNNPEAAADRLAMWYSWDTLGLYYREGLLNKSHVYKQYGTYIIWAWQKFGDVIKRWREVYNLQGNLENFEYLFGEMVKMREEEAKKLPSEMFMEYKGSKP